MKEQIKIRLLIASLLMVLFTACAFAQSNNPKNYVINEKLNEKVVKLDLIIRIDNKDVYDTCYKISVVNYNTNKTTRLTTNNRFILHLDYNTNYEIFATYKNLTHSILIDTKSVFDDWYIITGINLKTN